MDFQTLINGGLLIISSATGWFAREMWNAVKELKGDLSKLREELPRQYVARDDYRSDIRELKDMLTRLFDRLDHKVDK